jgi:hypothetical protein
MFGKDKRQEFVSTIAAEVKSSGVAIGVGLIALAVAIAALAIVMKGRSNG